MIGGHRVERRDAALSVAQLLDGCYGQRQRDGARSLNRNSGVSPNGRCAPVTSRKGAPTLSCALAAVYGNSSNQKMKRGKLHGCHGVRSELRSPGVLQRPSERGPPSSQRREAGEGTHRRFAAAETGGKRRDATLFDDIDCRTNGFRRGPVMATLRDKPSRRPLRRETPCS